MEILESHNTTRSDEDNTTVEHLSETSARRDSSAHQLRIVPMKVPQRTVSSITNSTGMNKTMEKSQDESKMTFSTNSEN